jgi:hypothetical protein
MAPEDAITPEDPEDPEDPDAPEDVPASSGVVSPESVAELHATKTTATQTPKDPKIFMFMLS